MVWGSGFPEAACASCSLGSRVDAGLKATQ